MKTPERAGAPAIGNAVGFFFILWLIPKVTWLDASDEGMAVAMAGTLFIHFFAEVRDGARWCAKRFKRPE